LKVAFVANTCWNIYNFRKGLVQHFLRRGDEVLALTPKDEYVTLVKDWGVKWIETPLDATGANPLKDWGYMKSIREAFSNENPNVVLSYTIKSNIYSCIMAKPLHIPVVCNVSGLGTVFLVKGLKGKFAIRLYKYAFKHAAFVFFQNADDKSLFLSKIQVPDKRIGLLPGSGINLQEFERKEYIPTDSFRFLMISRLIIEKGVNEFAEAASHFSDNENVLFTLVGKLDEYHSRTIRKEDLEKWTKDGRLNYLPHSDKIKELIEKHDALVLPSYREGTSRTLLEGAALGRALIASNVPGCIEVVEDGINGFLFEVKNSKSLVDKLRLYMSLSSAERTEMAYNSRRLVEQRFDEKSVIDAYKNVISLITDQTSV